MSTSTAEQLLPRTGPTGPRTPAGKDVVARNGIRHALSAKKVLLKGEEQAFSELLERLTAELEPVGVLEEQLVLRLAHSFLRCQRADAYMKGVLESEDSNEVGVGKAFYRDAFKADALTKALRHLTSAERSALTLHHEVLRLRHARTTGQTTLVPALDVIVTAPEPSDPPADG